jgi:hypothetical protein
MKAEPPFGGFAAFQASCRIGTTVALIHSRMEQMQTQQAFGEFISVLGGRPGCRETQQLGEEHVAYWFAG